MLIYKIIAFLVLFLVGEIIFNFTLINYLKKYFNDSVEAQETTENEKPTDKNFLGLNISIFKGVLERFVISLCLISNILTILIVFGALKLGTRITENPNIKNDYFLIGNLSSILISVFYYNTFKLICPYLINFA